MVKDGSSDFFDDLDICTRAEIERWNSKRAFLLQTRMQQEMDAKLEELDFDMEQSMPFVKVLVASCATEISPDSDPCSEEAILTIWRPSSEQLDSLEEGVVLRVKNLDTKTGRFDGRRQFSGGSSTPISTLPAEAYQPSECASSREYTTMFRIHLASKRLWKDLSNEQSAPDFDVLGFPLKVKELDDRQGCWIYLTDESHLLLRVQCDADCHDLASFLSSFMRDNFHAVAGFRYLRMMPFDYTECCAVAQYRGPSRFLPKPSGRQADNLHQLSLSDEGRDQLRKLSLYLDIGVQETVSSGSNSFQAIGYIAGFRVLSTQPQLLVCVDCGEPTLHTWKFPLALISSFAGSCQELEEFVVLNAEEEVKLTQLTSIGRAFRARQNNYCFSLQSIADSPADYPECKFEVSHISTVDTSALAALYSTLLQ